MTVIPNQEMTFKYSHEKLTRNNSGSNFSGAIVDRLSVDTADYFYAFSVTGPEQQIEAIRASLAMANNNVMISPNNRVYAMSDKGFQQLKLRGGHNTWYRMVEKEKYLVLRERLDYGLVHMVAWIDSPIFMMNGTKLEMWRLFKSDRYTTPVIWEWLDWITQELVSGRSFRLASGKSQNAKMVSLGGINCDCKLIKLEDETFDKLISYGLSNQLIKIPNGEDCI